MGFIFAIVNWDYIRYFLGIITDFLGHNSHNCNPIPPWQPYIVVTQTVHYMRPAAPSDWELFVTRSKRLIIKIWIFSQIGNIYCGLLMLSSLISTNVLVVLCCCCFCCYWWIGCGCTIWLMNLIKSSRYKPLVPNLVHLVLFLYSPY